MFSLKAGDKVGIASPAGHIPGFESIKLALDYIESLGLRYVIGANAYNVSRYMAGTDEERAEDLMSFSKTPKSRPFLRLPAVAVPSACWTFWIMKSLNKTPNPSSVSATILLCSSASGHKPAI